MNSFKLISLLAALVLLSACSTTAKHVIEENKQSHVVEKLRQGIRVKLLGTVARLIPPNLPDPLLLPDINLDLSSIEALPLEGTLSVARAVITGVSTITDELRLRKDGINDIVLEYQVDATAAGATGNYAADIFSDSLTVTGEGSFSGRVTNGKLVIGARLSVDTSNDRAQVSDITVAVDFRTLVIRAEKLKVNGILIPWPIVNAAIKPIVNTILDIAREQIIPDIEKLLNEVLEDIPWSEIVSGLNPPVGSVRQ